MIRHVLRMVTPAVVLILICALPAFADYEADKSAWDAMRPAEALREWRAAAKERDALAEKMTARQVDSAWECARLWRLVGGARKKSSSSPPASPVRDAQGLLAKLCYQPGRADGLWGARSARAYGTFLAQLTTWPPFCDPQQGLHWTLGQLHGSSCSPDP